MFELSHFIKCISYSRESIRLPAIFKIFFIFLLRHFFSFNRINSREWGGYLNHMEQSANDEFLDIYNRNIKRVYQICMLYLKNNTDAEDSAQIVFLKYLKSKKVFDTLEHEKAWFIRVTINHCKDVQRCWWKSRRVDIEKVPEIHMKEEKDYDLLKDELMELPIKYKEVLFLYYFEGFAVKEISKQLKRNESTIRTQLAKGRELLKINMGGYYDEKC